MKLTYSEIMSRLREERAAGYTSEQAVDLVIDLIGPKGLREALREQLLSYARLMPDAIELAEARKKKEEKKAEEVRLREECDKARKAQAKKARDERKYRKKHGILSDREKRALEKLEYEKEKERELTEINSERAGDGLPPLFRTRWDGLRTAEWIEEDSKLSPFERLTRSLSENTERYAIQAYGDKLWTGTEWVLWTMVSLEQVDKAITHYEAQAEEAVMMLKRLYELREELKSNVAA